MKKYICCFLLFSFIFTQNTILVNAQTNDGYKIVLRKGGEQLIDIKTKQEIFPDTCSKIQKTKIDKYNIYLCKNRYIFSPEGLYDNYIGKYIEYNNKFSNVKFENYPKEGTLRIKNKNNKDVFITSKDKVLRINNPMHKYNIISTDNSVINRILGISFFDPDEEYYDKFISSPFVQEDVEIKNGVLTVTYQNIDYNYDLYRLDKYKNIKFKGINAKDIINRAQTLSEIYDYISKNTPFELINYPSNAMFAMGSNLIIFENGKKVSKLNENYQSLYFTDKNILINKLLAINISFQNNENIIAKKNDKWGIIDKNNNIKVPFIYDAIFPKGSSIKETVLNAQDLDTDKLKIKFEEQTNDINLFVALKDEKYGVINDTNTVLIPFQEYKTFDNKDLKQLKKYYSKELKKSNIKNIFATVGSYAIVIIILPISIPFACLILPTKF